MTFRPFSNPAPDPTANPKVAAWTPFRNASGPEDADLSEVPAEMKPYTPPDSGFLGLTNRSANPIDMRNPLQDPGIFGSPSTTTETVEDKNPLLDPGIFGRPSPMSASPQERTRTFLGGAFGFSGGAEPASTGTGYDDPGIFGTPNNPQQAAGRQGLISFLTLGGLGGILRGGGAEARATEGSLARPLALAKENPVGGGGSLAMPADLSVREPAALPSGAYADQPGLRIGTPDAIDITKGLQEAPPITAESLRPAQQPYPAAEPPLEGQFTELPPNGPAPLVPGRKYTFADLAQNAGITPGENLFAPGETPMGIETKVRSGLDLTKLPDRAASDTADAAAGRVPTTDVSTTPSLRDQLAASLKAKGRPDLIVGDDLQPVSTPPSSFVAANPGKLAIHDANEAVIKALREFGPGPEVEKAMQAVKDAGGDLNHTADRIRAAGLPGPTRAAIKDAKAGKITADQLATRIKGDTGGEVPPSTAAVPPVRGGLRDRLATFNKDQAGEGRADLGLAGKGGLIDRVALAVRGARGDRPTSRGLYGPPKPGQFDGGFSGNPKAGAEDFFATQKKDWSGGMWGSAVTGETKPTAIGKFLKDDIGGGTLPGDRPGTRYGTPAEVAAERQRIAIEQARFDAATLRDPAERAAAARAAAAGDTTYVRPEDRPGATTSRSAPAGQYVPTEAGVPKAGRGPITMASLGRKTGTALSEGVGLLKTGNTALSPLHALGRHTASLALSHPVAYAKGAKSGAITFANFLKNPTEARATMQDTIGRYKSNLALNSKSVESGATPTGAARLEIRNPHGGARAGEDLVPSQLLNKIPGVGRAVEGAQAAFSMTQNTARYNALKGAMNQSAKIVGRSLTEAEKGGLADRINHFTGRGFRTEGDIAKKVGMIANVPLYSPQLQASYGRMAGDVVHAIAHPKSVESLETMRLAAGTLGRVAVYAGVAHALGLGVDLDPNSGNFLKIDLGPKDGVRGALSGIASQLGEGTITETNGHVYLDMTHGMSGYVKAVAQTVNIAKSGKATFHLDLGLEPSYDPNNIGTPVGNSLANHLGPGFYDANQLRLGNQVKPLNAAAPIAFTGAAEGAGWNPPTLQLANGHLFKGEAPADIQIGSAPTSKPAKTTAPARTPLPTKRPNATPTR